MPYYRRAAKRPRYGKRDKYSIQQKASVASIAANHTSVVDIVPATTTEGMRKVKHLTCNLTQVVAGGSSAESSLFWALVYVPRTAASSTLQQVLSGSTLYISRNLNDGDKISLLIRPTLDGVATIVSLCVLYALSLSIK